MSKRYVEPHWEYDMTMRLMRHFRGGEFDEAQEVPLDAYDVNISVRLIPGLIEAARGQGFFSITPESRAEDLKIIHKLLDIVAQGATP